MTTTKEEMLSKGRPLIITHGDCHDGMGCILASRIFFRDDADYYMARRYEEPPCVKDRPVFIFDWSYPRDVIERMIEESSFFVLRDHHSSARDKLGDLPETYFDTTRAGCYLAWEYFHPDTEPPLGFKMIEDYDLWQFKYPDTEPYIYNLLSHPFDHDIWEEIVMNTPVEEVIEQGRHIERYFNKQLHMAIKYNMRDVVIDGVPGKSLNTAKMFANKAGSTLASITGTYALIWAVNDHGKVVCSVRSAAGTDHAQRIAEKFGGGGHPQSASFKMESPQEFLNLIGL